MNPFLSSKNDTSPNLAILNLNACDKLKDES